MALKRFSVFATQNVAVATTTGTQIAQNLLPLPKIDATQGLIIHSIVAALFDPNQLGRIAVFGFNVNLVLLNAAAGQVRIARSWQAPVGGAGFLLAAQGIRVAASEEPIIYGTDYSEVANFIGAAPGMFALVTGADLVNPGAGTPVTFTTTALLEIVQTRIPA